MSVLAVAAIAAGCIVAAAVAGIAGRRRRPGRDEGSGRHTRPKALDLDALGVGLPPPGKLGAVLFMKPECAPCSPVKARLAALDTVVVSEIDLAARPAAAQGITAVPTLYLVDADGAVVRSWVGEPLRGTLERTVEATLSD